MKLKYLKLNKTKLKRDFLWFTIYKIPKDENDTWWFNKTLKKWTCGGMNDGYSYSNVQDCSSVRAFRRMLKKAPGGVVFILISKWIGRDIIGRGSFKQINTHDN